MKKALIVSNPFLPADNPCVRRSVSFIMLLRNYGWEPVILTREATATDDIDDDTADLEIPDGMDVYRTNPWQLEELPGLLGAAGKHLAQWFLTPDNKRLWELFSHRKAARIVKYDGIDLIYTASPAKSPHLLGLYLKKKFPQIPWIADICPENPAYAGKARAEREIDRRISKMADCIVASTEAFLEAIRENQQGRAIEDKCFVIPDGFAQELSEVFEKSCRLLAAKRLVQ